MEKNDLIDETARRNITAYLAGVSKGFFLDSVAGEDDDESFLDVRLQVEKTDNGVLWSVYTGDASYDQDHRGYWGASSVSGLETRKEIDFLAEDLIEQVEDSYCQDEERLGR